MNNVQLRRSWIKLVRPRLPWNTLATLVYSTVDSGLTITSLFFTVTYLIIHYFFTLSFKTQQLFHESFPLHRSTVSVSPPDWFHGFYTCINRFYISIFFVNFLNCPRAVYYAAWLLVSFWAPVKHCRAVSYLM